MSRPFLTARWSNLGLVTYAVDPALLADLLPPGCVPDLIDGAARVSLVAFDFRDARVFGLRWPGHVNFPEVNLRYYVRHGDERGVAFVGELVPRRAIAAIARRVYNEPYAAVPMTSRTREDDATVTIEHELTVGGRPQRIVVAGRKPPVTPEAGADAHWLKEHRWGFGRTRGGRLLSYEVVHPTWAVYPDATAELAFDFGRAYGERWAFLAGERPASVLLAAGSAVSVSPKRLLG